MKVKEMIEWIEECKDQNLGEEYDNKKMSQIITLLQQGEKYQQMWEELFMEEGMLLTLQDDGYSKLLYKILEDLEQKYFPKGANNANNNR